MTPPDGEADERTDDGGGVASVASASGEPPVGLVFELLDNQRRRYVMHYLLQREAPVELRELSRQVAAWENHEPLEEVSADERHRVYNALQQVHLPKMDDAGVVEYDRDRGTVAPTPGLGDLRVYLEVVPGNDIPWSTYYLLLGAFAGTVTVAVWADVLVFSLVPDVAVAVVLSLLLLGSAAVHAVHNRRMSLGTSGPPPEYDRD